MGPDISTLKSGTRLREAGALHILDMRRDGSTYQQIAIVMGVSLGTVYNICSGRTWGWLTKERDATTLAPST